MGGLDEFFGMDAGSGTSGRPRRRTLRVGFLALADSAPIVIAPLLGCDARHGIRIEPVRYRSWAALRDALLDGILDAAQALYGLVYAVENGIGPRRARMAVLSTLSRNGQAITLSRRLAEAGVRDGPSLARAVRSEPRRLALAQTFPTGTHALWLNYWLAAHDIDPLREVDIVTVPPERTVDQLEQGTIDGYCAGEPWNELAVRRGAGFTVATSQQIWPDHPEKALATTAAFAEADPASARALVKAVLDAARFVDAPAHRERAAHILAGPGCLDCDPEIVAPRFCGRYRNGLGDEWMDDHPVAFFGAGDVPFPYVSDAVWVMAQQQRWGMLPRDVDCREVAERVQRIDLYSAAAAEIGLSVPASASRHSRLMDGVSWDGLVAEPSASAAGPTGAAAHEFQLKGNVR